jgi:2'-5' RNA ligase
MTETKSRCETQKVDHSALIVRIPKLDDIISRVRRVAGVPESVFPTHVTVMSPFPSASDLSCEDILALKECCSQIEKFNFTLDQVAWFADEVVYFHIEQSDKFLSLTEAISEKFGLLPYEGKHENFVPHVTIALNDTAEHLHLAAKVAEFCLPVVVSAESLVVWEKDENGRWSSSLDIELASKE